MKMNTKPTFVETNNIGQTSQATIKASAKLFNFFADQIYSDKFTAIWRELVANGIDAQRVNGSTRSPIVTLPSMLEPYAKVRDFGTGMGHEFMMNKFMAFTDASTKESSDDFIGGFGIGSKAPLSYSDQYSIKNFQSGTVRVYSVYKDESDCPCIAFLSEEPTSEPDGCEVGFPVRQSDVHKFSETVINTLQYFDPLPVLENTQLELKPVEYDVKGKKWGIRVLGPNRNPRIIIGGVGYPLQVGSISYSYPVLRQFGQMGLDIYLGIGEANIALSRESVTHDDELFVKLTEIVEGIGDEFGKQISEQFKNCKTLWEAKVKLSEALESADHHTSDLIRRNVKWNGEKIKTNVTRPDDFPVLVIPYAETSWNRGWNGMPCTQAVAPKFRAWSGGSFAPKQVDMIVIDDGPLKPSLRIRKVIDENPTYEILFLRDNSAKDEDDVDWDEYLKALGGPPKSLVHKLSEFEPLKIVRTPGATVTRPFKCYVSTQQPYRGSSHQSELPKDGGMYIAMDNFSPEDENSDIRIARRAEPKNIVWLNKTDFSISGVESNPNWFSVEQAIAKVKADYRSNHKRLAEAEAWYQWSKDNGSLVNRLEKLAKLANFPKQGPLFQLYKLHLAHADTTTDQHSEVRSTLLEVKYDKHTAKISKLEAQAVAKHPYLFELIESYTIHHASDGMINALI